MDSLIKKRRFERRRGKAVFFKLGDIPPISLRHAIGGGRFPRAPYFTRGFLMRIEC